MFALKGCSTEQSGALLRGEKREDVTCYPDLPRPEAKVGAGGSVGTDFTIYLINILNASAYPAELLKEDETLPPCPGYDTSPWKTPMKVRKCIAVRGDDGMPYPVSGASLEGFTVQLPGQTKPTTFVITLTDRQCGITYTSQPAPASAAGFHEFPPDWHI